MKLNFFTIIKLFLAVFIGVGLGLTIFMIVQDVKIVGAYIVSGLFILVPGTLLYGITFGFKVSERTLRKQAERQKSISFDSKGMTYKMPLFDISQFIDWKTIETVIYTAYQTDDNLKFIFYLTQPASQTMTENPWFLNRVFPFAFKNRKDITIEDDCKNFQEIPEMLKKYLGDIDFVDLTEDDRKGTLLGSKTTIKNNSIRVEEHWQPNQNYERHKVVYDKYNRTFEQIKLAGNT